MPDVETVVEDIEAVSVEADVVPSAAVPIVTTVPNMVRTVPAGDTKHRLLIAEDEEGWRGMRL